VGAAGIAMQGAEQLFRPAGIETEGITDVEVGIPDCLTRSCEREFWQGDCGAVR
jgi:hypothetical protein